MTKIRNKFHSRVNRKIRVRKKIFGFSDRPRLSVFRSLKHIYAQIIDDTKGITLASSSSLDVNLKPTSVSYTHLTLPTIYSV